MVVVVVVGAIVVLVVVVGATVVVVVVVQTATILIGVLLDNTANPHNVYVQDIEKHVSLTVWIIPSQSIYCAVKVVV